MTELEELYQEVILDHAKSPRNHGRLDLPTHSAEAHNPLCGDQLTITLRIEDGHVADACFDGCGCAISMAAASLLLESIKGQPIEKATEVIQGVREVLVEGSEQPLSEELEALRGVRRFPMRVKCATLAIHALREALECPVQG